MLSEKAIQAELKHLYAAKSYWESQFEKAMQERNFQSMACHNSTIVKTTIAALEMVLFNKPLYPLIDDNEQRYSLMSDTTYKEIDKNRNITQH